MIRFNEIKENSFVHYYPLKFTIYLAHTHTYTYARGHSRFIYRSLFPRCPRVHQTFVLSRPSTAGSEIHGRGGRWPSVVPHNSIPWDAAAEGPRDFVWIQLARDVHQPDNQAHGLCDEILTCLFFFIFFLAILNRSKVKTSFPVIFTINVDK